MKQSILSIDQDKLTALGINQRLSNINISIIKEMMYLAQKEMEKGREIISLGVGIPFYKMPSYIREGVIKALQSDPTIDKYTFFPGMPKLRKLIAQKDTKRLGFEVNKDNILVTAGSMGALLYASLALVQNPEDEIILPSPYFSSYAEQIKLAGGTPREVPMIEPQNSEESYQLDIEGIKRTITKNTKAIIINSPHNPTGAIFAKEDLMKLAEVIKVSGIYLITDEVYDYLIYDADEYFNIASIKDLWPRVIRCCSFSKKYGMTGWRIGYIDTNPDLARQLFKIHDNAIVCASHIAQEAVYIALSSESEEIVKNVGALKKNRDLTCKKLDELAHIFSYSKPRGAYYVFPRYKSNLSSVDFSLKVLKECGVIVVPGIGFGQAGENHIRISFGGEYGEIETAFSYLSKLE
ncbi:hypothetical protein A2866_00365 [Candidatus Roizmanbacteria bacterium RIFCSPHIGHO2_01_FULL_39_8]|uniref:Aminotransferase n=2 Tax=Candidatus Roizmaniibacteriota TaxID=1752723 RepID=A0A1F7GJQ3_9BACT|nr:MAG: hypothetical protein A2866_00365 [Candidatus Roizmanbacteria bacterium RIFCSPHIGHO2_01_FULL_39_8]OGK26233.1 MAG: hypothetical protein A3C28_03510 [Candidatus Roizmanbacteria bacterium RIFCSPHIGHO2_02_FULL_39_9]